MSNYKNCQLEPPVYAIGGSRGGVTTKIHRLCDARLRPLVVIIAPGQGGDATMFLHLLDCLGGCPPRSGLAVDDPGPDLER